MLGGGCRSAIQHVREGQNRHAVVDVGAAAPPYSHQCQARTNRTNEVMRSPTPVMPDTFEAALREQSAASEQQGGQSAEAEARGWFGQLGAAATWFERREALDLLSLAGSPAPSRVNEEDVCGAIEGPRELISAAPPRGSSGP